MAKLSGYRRLIKTDFAQEYQPLIEQLGVSINNGFDTVFNALNGKLNFADNILSTIAEFRVTVREDGTPQQTTQFRLDKNQSNLIGLLVLSITGADDPSLRATSGLAISYTPNSGTVTISNIKGLEAGKPYLIRVLALS
jgi:hypothetical protein